MEKNGADQGKLFNSANKPLAIKESLAACFPDHLDNMLLTNDVTNFFVKKIDNIHSQITLMKINVSDIALMPPDLMMDEDKTLCSFRCLTGSDVRAIITKSAKKSGKLDPLPTPLLVNCLDELLAVIATMVNLPLK